MINKIFKRIHSRFYRFINFFFFLKYVFAIFLITASIFLTIPKFFNYEKKEKLIKIFLKNYYDLEINNNSKIEYKIFPYPNLFITNLNFKIKNKPINFKSNSINIFLDYKNIYNYKNFKGKKVVFEESEILTDFNNLKDLINYFKNLKYKFNIKKLNINLLKDNKPLIKIKDINFTNYGYRKYNIEGKVFDKKFEASLKKNNTTLNFKLSDTGIKAKFELNEKDLYSGSAKVNLSNNLLRFNFYLKNNQLKINRSNFRNKDLSFSLDSIIKFDPFFNVYSNVNINEIDKNLMNNISLDKILKRKEIIKKLNNKINIQYKSKKYFTELIESYSSEMYLAYGRLNFSNKIIFLGNEMKCSGDSILIDDYPRLNFNCLINLKNKKFYVNKKLNKEPFNINIDGSLNLFSKKVKFRKINIDKKYSATKEDIKYFEEKFEDILYDKNFFQIFKKNKIEKIFLEII